MDSSGVGDILDILVTFLAGLGCFLEDAGSPGQYPDGEKVLPA